MEVEEGGDVEEEEVKEGDKLETETAGGEKSGADNVQSLLLQRYSSLGPLSSEESQVLGMFLLLVVLWLTRCLSHFPLLTISCYYCSFYPRSPGFAPGWADVLPPGVGDASPAILVTPLA